MSFFESMNYLIKNDNKLNEYKSEHKKVNEIKIKRDVKNKEVKLIKFHNIHEDETVHKINLLSAKEKEENFNIKMQKAGKSEINVTTPSIIYELNLSDGITHKQMMKNNIETENGISNDFNRRLRQTQGSDLEEIKNEDIEEQKTYEFCVASVIADYKKTRENYDNKTSNIEKKVDLRNKDNELKELKKPYANRLKINKAFPTAATASAATPSATTPSLSAALDTTPLISETVNKATKKIGKKVKNIGKKVKNKSKIQEFTDIYPEKNEEEIRENPLKSNNNDNDNNNNDNESVNTDKTDDLQQNSSDRGILNIINICKINSDISDINKNQRAQINNICKKYNFDKIDSRMRLKSTIIKKFNSM